MEDQERLRCPIPEELTTAAIDNLPSRATLLSHDNGVSRSIRTTSPADYILTITSFSTYLDLVREGRAELYMSHSFESGGYKWRLALYPDGDKKRNVNDHISLYLVLVETNKLPHGWEVNVNFKLFVYDQIRDNYYTVQDVDGKVARFNEMKTEHGFANLMSLAAFNNASNGYLIDDSCTFGAEVFVIENNRKVECLSTTWNHDYSHHYSWKLSNLSKLNKDCYFSPVFSAAGKKWMLAVDTDGDDWDDCDYSKLYISLRLIKSESYFNFNFMRWFRKNEGTNISQRGDIYAEYTIRVRDQVNGNHKEDGDGCWFRVDTPSSFYSINDLMSLSELRDQSNGFLMNDTLIIDLEFNVIREIKDRLYVLDELCQS